MIRASWPTIPALFCLGTAGAAAQPISVAAASDLRPVLPIVAERFERETGRRVRLTFGSSGNFYSQIENGAPFDVFVSADVDYPRRLEERGLTEPGSLYAYATGRIVLWAPKDRALEVDRGLRLLLDTRVRHVAIANPDHAPYGRAAVAALRHAGVYEQIRGKLVLGDNVAQAAQFVESGNAEVGIIALSLALAPRLRETGAYYEVPASFYRPFAQGAVVVRRARDKAAALQFVAFLKRPEIQSLLQQSGLQPPSPGPSRS